MLLKRKEAAYRRVLRGGNEVLRICYAEPEGESAAAIHTRALIDALLVYANEALADRVWEEMNDHTAGAARFQRYRYEIDWREESETGGHCITLTTLLTRGREIQETRTLAMHWDEDGAYQRMPKSGGTVSP